MFEKISLYVPHVFWTLWVMPTLQTCFPERMGTEVQLITHRKLTFSPLLCSLMKWVTRIQYGSSAADILTTIDLTQAVRDFNFLPFICGWHSHYDWPGSERTWFQFLTVHRRMTFSLRLAWLREYVIWISYRSSAANIFTMIVLAQGVRDFNFLPFIGGWYSRYDWPGSGSTWFQLVTVHGRLIFSLQLAWLSMFVISISYGSSAADILTPIGLPQRVRDFNFLRSIGGWRSLLRL